MGCDIHMFIEFKCPHTDRWTNFGKKITPLREYDLFRLLAGARSNDLYPSEPLRPLKGFPEDASGATIENYCYFITESVSADIRLGNVTREEAANLIKNNYAKYYTPDYLRDNRNAPIWVTRPDWHHCTWLSAEEYGECLLEYTKRNSDILDCFGYIEPEYRVVLATLREFERLRREARVVFWFDN
jgi:hypothetical protein